MALQLSEISYCSITTIEQQHTLMTNEAMNITQSRLVTRVV